MASRWRRPLSRPTCLGHPRRESANVLITTRFAPAPTGYLHLGHVANAIYVWGIARARRGRVLLRVEDHDRQRCRPEYESALLEDLAWLGFRPDTGTVDEFRSAPSPYRQSDSYAAYEEALQKLRAHYRVYACECSRREEAERAETAEQAGRSEEGETAGEIPYSGHCRERGLADGLGRGLRLVIPPGEERFTDLSVGDQTQDPSTQCGDLLLKDRLGNWTYQFAVVVDDLRHGVDLVIRGQDLLASTGRQLRLARMLGREAPPSFLHHPLIVKPSGEKLSKASGDTSVRELRAAGLSAAQVIGRAAHTVGLLPKELPLQAQDTAQLFT